MFFNEKGSAKSEEVVRESFERVKSDIFSLGNELNSLKNDFCLIKSELAYIVRAIENLNSEVLFIKSALQTRFLPIPTDIPTHPPINPANTALPSDNPTVPQEIGGLKDLNFGSSIGNRGVPTDRQTNQQTDNLPLKEHIEAASELLDSLDAIKKEIRLKFKHMTQQEMVVFSTIYQLESELPEGVEYRTIASKLRLSESSVRDYIQKIISKGIPVDKIKLNNKKILLKISPELKKIATLQTIIKLREL